MNDMNILGVLIKYPEPGKVKTRLATHIGIEAAAFFCRRIAEHVLKRTAPADFGYVRIVFYTPEEMRQQFADWLPDELLKVQRGRDVGERMEHALEEMFALGAEKAIVVGADIPGLHREIIDHAFQYLDHADMVIGPAMDGGYYLIGMKSPYPEIFWNIAWGTGEVFRKTVDNIEKKGLHYHAVKTLFDVDGLGDFLKAEEMMKDAEN